MSMTGCVWAMGHSRRTSAFAHIAKLELGHVTFFAFAFLRLSCPKVTWSNVLFMHSYCLFPFGGGWAWLFLVPDVTINHKSIIFFLLQNWEDKICHWGEQKFPEGYFSSLTLGKQCFLTNTLLRCDEGIVALEQDCVQGKHHLLLWL